MLKKLVVGVLLIVLSLIGGLGLVLVSIEKDYMIFFFEYVIVDEKIVDLFNKLSVLLKEDIKIMLVLLK